MSASFVIELDTTAPAVTLSPGSVDSDGTLLLPYTITEPGITSAVIDGVEMSTAVDGLLMLRGAPRSGLVHLHVADDVGNADEIVLSYRVARFVGRIAAGVVGAIRNDTPSGVTGAIRQGLFGRIARGKKGGIQ